MVMINNNYKNDDNDKYDNTTKDNVIIVTII